MLKDSLKTILIIDGDNESIRSATAMLAGLYRTIIASSIFEAVKWLMEEIPDVILMDYVLLGNGNTGRLDVIRASTGKGNVPIIFWSGINDRQKVLEALRLKPNGYILKPANQHKLIATIENVLWKRPENPTVSSVDEAGVQELHQEINQVLDEVNELLANIAF